MKISIYTIIPIYLAILVASSNASFAKQEPPVQIYDKFLKDHLKAREECKKYLERYPRGEFSGPIKEELNS